MKIMALKPQKNHKSITCHQSLFKRFFLRVWKKVYINIMTILKTENIRAK